MRFARGCGIGKRGEERHGNGDENYTKRILEM